MRLALIDGDLLCYKAAHVYTERYHFDEDQPATFLDKKGAARAICGEVNDLADVVKADRVLVCLSDAKENFRKALYGRYKAHRPGEKPQLVYFLRDVLAEAWPTIVVSRLEGDDLLGLLSTTEAYSVHPAGKAFFKGVKSRVMVSNDKDLRTVPGLLYNPGRPDEGIVEISRLDADRAFYSQVLTGDTCDNYPGCPGVGPKSKWVRAVQEADTEYGMWQAVVACYQTKAREGETIDDRIEAATVQAQMARILRPGEYDFAAGRVRLWTPKSIVK